MRTFCISRNKKIMKIWQNFNVFTLLLAPFSLLFWLISRVRFYLYHLNILPHYRAPIPVLVVGNISVGGNGKTPLVVWLVEQLQAQGVRVGVISRGYGGKTRDYPQLVNAETAAELVGDEPVLIAKRTGAPVAVSPNRRQSIELLLQQYPPDLIIADDGLQHYALARDLEWVVVDGERRFGNGFLLPAGGLRELPSRLKQVQAVICNGENAQPGEFQMRLQPSVAVNLKTGEARALNDFVNTQNIALAGIGYPPRFFNMLKSLNIPLQAQHAFADHQHFSPAQLQRLASAQQMLLMTEKDAVKCQAFAQDNWWFVPISAVFTEKETACLLDPIITLVRKTR